MKRNFALIVILITTIFALPDSLASGNNQRKTEPSSLQIAESDSPRAVLGKTLSASHSVKSYRLRIEASDSQTATIMEYAFPDSARRFRNDEEFIRVGKNIFHKKGEGAWEKYPEEDNYSYLPAKALENHINTLAEAKAIKFIGQETVDGMPTRAYQITHPGSEPNREKAWIGVDDGLLRRWEFLCIVSGSTSFVIVYTYYDYNADIKIEAPTKYVTVNPPRSSPITRKIEIDPNIRPASGVGTGSGIGSGAGGGIGSGDGKGIGPGQGFKTGDRNAVATVVDQRPVPLNAPQPRYTEEARKNKIEGVVIARVLVSADGGVKQVKITRGLPVLDEQAIQTAYQMRFKPAIKDGQPVAFWQSVLIEFTLPNDRK